MSWRVFAALELPAEVREQLRQRQHDLQAALPPRAVRWVRPEGIHLTLKFYGDIDPARLPELKAGLGRAAATTASLPLALAGLGVFPNAARPEVVWVGVTGALEPLRRLAAEVEREAAALGFKPDGRAYQPHLTLGRVNAGADARRLMDALSAAAGGPPTRFTAAQLSLMNSELQPGGSVYTPLYRAALATAPQTT